MAMDHRESRIRAESGAGEEAGAGHFALWLSLVVGNTDERAGQKRQAKPDRRLYFDPRRAGPGESVQRPDRMGRDGSHSVDVFLQGRPAGMDFLYGRADVRRALLAGEGARVAGVLLLGARDGRPRNLGIVAGPQVSSYYEVA